MQNKIRLTVLSICIAMPLAAMAQPVMSQRDLAGLSKQTKNVLHRYESCLHFAGEWSGDPKLDQYVRKRTQELGCAHIDQDVSQLRRTKSHRSQTLKLIKKLERAYGVSP